MNLFRYVFRAIEVRQPIEINIVIIGAKNMYIFFGLVVFFFFEYLRMSRQNCLKNGGSLPRSPVVAEQQPWYIYKYESMLSVAFVGKINFNKDPFTELFLNDNMRPAY
jgi:hypothetical protein